MAVKCFWLERATCPWRQVVVHNRRVTSFTHFADTLLVTARVPADVLIVEGWIGRDGIRAAKEEFEAGGYRYLVATGGYTGEGWLDRRWSHAEMAEEELVRLHFPREQLLVAKTSPTDSQRTYESAVVGKEALEQRRIQIAAVNVFTRGPHARRSRLVFAKVFGASTPVGVVSWNPPGSTDGTWWRSSERAREFIGETAGYWFEVLLSSGRWLQSKHTAHVPASIPACPGNRSQSADTLNE